MQTTNPPILDYFKLFKLLTLKTPTLQKSGNVKLVLDKILNRKILAVQGNVSASNFIIFKASDHPNIAFNNKFLYIQGFCEPGKNFTFLLKVHLNSKEHKILISTLYKQKQPKQVGNVLQYPLKMQTNKWSLIIVDLFELFSNYSQKQEIKLSFKLSTVQIRASSLVKGIFLSDHFFSVDKLPKQIQFPKRTSQKEEQNFFTNYGLVLIGSHFMQIDKRQPQKQEKCIEQKSQKYKKQEKSVHDDSHLQSKNPEIISNTNIQIQSKVSQRQSTITNTKLSSRSTMNIKNKRQSQPIRKRQISTQSCKNIGVNAKYTHQQIGLIQQDQPIEHPLHQPKPKTTLNINLVTIQGMNLSKNSIVSVGSYIISPFMMQTHKSINCLYYQRNRPVDLLIGYKDGCIALWDTIKKRAVKYYKTQLVTIKQFLLDMSKTIIVVGQDQLKRDTILIMKDDMIIFQQLSNYNIHGIKLLNYQSFKDGMISYGFENIRLWKIKESNNIIVGSNIYLGKMCRNNLYTDCTLIGDVAYLVDQNGFLTKISVKTQQMISSKKISQEPLDHILFLPKQQQFIIVNSHGTIRLFNLAMEILCEFPLQQRIADVYFQSNRENTLQLIHYNKSAGVLDLNTGSYKFGTRCHTSSVLGLKYHRPTGNIISISKDQTIRLWTINLPNSQIRQQYQFRITNHSVSYVQVSNRNSWSLVGFDDGLIRKICLQECKVVGQVQILTQGKMIDQISISKDDKYVLVSSQKQSKLLDSDLNEINTYPARKISSKRHIKFNSENKSYFIQTDQESLQFFQLKNPSQPYCVLYLQASPQMISFNSNFVHVYGNNNYYLYKFNKQQSSFTLNNIISHYKTPLKQAMALQFPLLSGCNQNELLLMICDLSSYESISIPQPLQQIQICTKESLIIGAGKQSNSLYLFKYQSRNLPSVEDICQNDTNEINQNKQDSLSETIPIYMGNNWQLNTKNKAEEDCPKAIKSLYEEEQKLFQQCKQHIIPDIQQQQNQQSILEENQNQQHQFILKDNQSSETQLLYGADIIQPANRLLWDSNHRILFYASKHNLICHYFTQPISQKIIELSILPSKIQLSRSKYLGVSMSSIIRLYNRIETQISFSKNIEVNSVHTVSDWTFTPCQNYIIALGTNVNHIGKLIITVLEITTGNPVACSYLELTPPTGSSSSKKVHQFNELIKSFKIELNPFNNKAGVQFCLFSKTLIYFYRVTSMLTLQMQQLQLQKIKDHLGNLTTLSYAILTENEQVILLGSDNGSILVIDSRSGDIVVLCKETVKCSLSKIFYYDGTLVLLSNNQNILLFEEVCNVEGIIRAVDKVPKILTIDSSISSYSDINNNGQLLMLGSLGSLWLIDLADSLTIKILSFHNKPITVVKSFTKGYILTGSQDGFLRQTSLSNLQQERQIFKPRKTVRDFHYNKQKQILCVGFDNEIYFYHWQNQHKEHNKCYGSVSFKEHIISIAQIPRTLNYLIQTVKQIIMIYISNLPQENNSNSKFEIQMQPLTQSVSTFVSLQINKFLPYDVFMTCCQASKINVWMRKCLKRGHNPLFELEKVHDLQYYLIDTHCSKYSRENATPYCYFTGKEQYICAFPQQHSIQIRNFNQHILIQEITTDTAFSIFRLIENQHRLSIMIGDYEGYISILNMQGANIKKLRSGKSKIHKIEKINENLYGVVNEENLMIMQITV